MKADLHVHSNHSDGTKTIEELIEKAKNNKLDMIAITDHDTIAGFKEYQTLNIDYPLIAGVELSTYHNNAPIHILGYFYHNNIEVEELVNYLEKMKEKRNLRIQKIIKNLKKYFDIEVDYESVKKGSHGVIARPHIARVIQEKYGYDYQEIFDKYLNNDSPAYVDIDRLDTKDAIDMLHRNNAVAVLAHPIYLKDNSIEEIIELGIDGIEVYYEDQDESHFHQIAQDHNLLITGGSDYHGEIYPQDLGDKVLEGAELEIFLNRISKNEL